MESTAIAGRENVSETKGLTLSINAAGIAVITIDVPNSKVNTLSRASMGELNEILEELKSKSVKGLIIASGKKDSFVAGADVKEICRIQHYEGQIEAYNAGELGKRVFDKIAALPYPTVAAINGVCLGGGTELTLPCKYRIASPKAKIGLPEVQLGFVPGWGACVRMPHLLGIQKALELIMSGKILDAKRAWKAGLVDEVVEADKLLARAEEIAAGGSPKRYSKPFKETMMKLLLETNPLGKKLIRDTAYKAMMRETKGKYPAPKEALNLVLKVMEMPQEKAFELESRTFSRLAATSVSKNLVGIFFAREDSKRLPADVADPVKVTTIGVLGAGVMGAGIAQAAAKAGYKVVVRDIEQRFLDKGKETVSGLFDTLVEKRRLTREEADKIVNEMKFTTNYDDLAECDLIIEAILEDIELKQKTLAELDKAINKRYVFATNTSSLSVTDIAKGSKEPGKVAGMHFFNPVHKMPLVEIVRGKQTSDWALAAVMNVAQKLDKTTVITADSPGFVVNRILAPYLREAAVLAEEGVPIEQIDKAMKSFGMPMGPFTLLDEIGLDIAGKVLHVMSAAFGERLGEPPLMRAIAELKLLGKKGGKGIYLYDEKKKPTEVNPDVQAYIKAPATKHMPGEIQDRLVLLMLNEAARCMEENVISDPAQLDLAMIFGTGFPPFHGGILKYADAEGILVVKEKLDYLARVHGERYAPCKLIEKMSEERRPFYLQPPVPVA